MRSLARTDKIMMFDASENPPEKKKDVFKRNKLQYWPFKSVWHSVCIKVEGKYVPQHRKGRETRTGWHVSELVEHNQVMQKEKQKQQQKNISKAERIVNRGKYRRHGKA